MSCAPSPPGRSLRIRSSHHARRRSRRSTTGPARLRRTAPPCSPKPAPWRSTASRPATARSPSPPAPGRALIDSAPATTATRRITARATQRARQRPDDGRRPTHQTRPPPPRHTRHPRRGHPPTHPARRRGNRRPPPPRLDIHHPTPRHRWWSQTPTRSNGSRRHSVKNLLSPHNNAQRPVTARE